MNASPKLNDCYLGLLYAMEDVAVYGYLTPLKMKIVLALALSDSVVRDAEIVAVRRFFPYISAFHRRLLHFIRFSKLYTWLTMPPSRTHS